MSALAKLLIFAHVILLTNGPLPAMTIGRRSLDKTAVDRQAVLSMRKMLVAKVLSDSYSPVDVGRYTDVEMVFRLDWIEIEEYRGKVTCTGELTMRWNLDTVWEASYYENITELELPSMSVWTPPLSVLNFGARLQLSDRTLKLTNDGRHALVASAKFTYGKSSVIPGRQRYTVAVYFGFHAATSAARFIQLKIPKTLSQIRQERYLEVLKPKGYGFVSNVWQVESAKQLNNDPHSKAVTCEYKLIRKFQSEPTETVSEIDLPINVWAIPAKVVCIIQLAVLLLFLATSYPLPNQGRLFVVLCCQSTFILLGYIFSRTNHLLTTECHRLMVVWWALWCMVLLQSSLLECCLARRMRAVPSAVSVCFRFADRLLPFPCALPSSPSRRSSAAATPPHRYGDDCRRRGQRADISQMIAPPFSLVSEYIDGEMDMPRCFDQSAPHQSENEVVRWRHIAIVLDRVLLIVIFLVATVLIFQYV